MNSLDNGIEVFGVADCIDIRSNYFKEFDFQVNKELQGIIVEKILSINVNINIGDFDIIKTPIMLSNEGVFFSGYKLKVELIIDMKIKYMYENTLGLSKDKIIKTIYIVLPLEYNNTNMIDLLRKRKIIINSYVEDIYCELREKNILYTNLSAIIIADFNES
ncbi:hypothetical protein [Clostridium taeniosporum]|uniref:DUF3794 domain-containing protein n=1 Tax=Clostridium taeniosporum TaxID=394958 RepID=A0A1D7XLG3_9CLOT|nr:hypothetical protein [Clostridium taeniosporum]AOR24030.1 hypothetical protein BGI42_09935 [Clostridium taeniosporum]